MLKRPEAMQIFHDEIANFADTCEKSCAEALRCVRDVQRIARTVVSDAAVHLFGSQAAGLALSDSDIDIVVLSSSLPDVRANPSKKYIIIKFMQQMAEAIDSIEPKSIIHIEQMITTAAVPILKCITRNGRKCDLSFGVEGGLRAASLMKTEVQSYPAIRPILLVLKQLLKEQDLNEVYRGGVSSYGLFHMVLSYFSTRRQQPGKPPDKATGNGADAGHVVRVTEGSFPYFRRLAAEESPPPKPADSDSDDPRPAPHPPSPPRSPYDGVCLGQALLDVLERYGTGFDAVTLAVHARRGLIPKAATRLEADRRDVGKPRLAVVDLLEPAHDVTSGSFNTPLILSAFSNARRALEAAVRDTCAYRASGVLGAALACAVRLGPAGRGGGKARVREGVRREEEPDGGGGGRRRFEEDGPPRVAKKQKKAAAGGEAAGGKKSKMASAAADGGGADSDGSGEGGWIPDIPPSAARRPAR